MKGMLRGALGLVLVVILALSLVACGQKGSPVEQELSAQEIVAASIEASTTARTHQFDTAMAVDIAGVSGGEVIEAGYSYAAHAAMNIETREIALQMSVETPDEQGTPVMADIDMYLIGDQVYMRMIGAGMPANAWMKAQVPPEYWEEANQLQQLQGLLVEALDVELVGTESLDGTEYYVLQARPDVERIWETLMQGQPGVQDFLAGAPFGLDQVVKSFSLKGWVAKDTFLLGQAQVQMNMVIDSKELEIPEAQDQPFRVTMDLQMDASFHSYNEPVSIELPPEAVDAVEVPGLVQ